MSDNDPARYRVISPAQILATVANPGAVVRVRTHRDVLPSGYPAAMMPMLVDWTHSRIEGPDPFVLLRNVNYGGNPLERTTVLQCARVPLDGLAYAEYTLVPLTAAGQMALVQHGHLRFVFEPGRQPRLQSYEGESGGSEDVLDDLVFSYEPWRPVTERFSFVRALRGDFGLSLRAYAGAQRFLEDALAGNDWFSFRLRMPGGHEGLHELLHITLALGDGLARNVIGRHLEQGASEWVEQAPPGSASPAELRAQWEEMRAWVEQTDLPDDLPSLAEPDQTYQTLLRSCASMARFTTLLTAERLVARGLDDGVDLEQLPPAVIGQVQPWMRGLSNGDLGAIFVRAPAALRYLMDHPSTLPMNIPDELDAAGLVERRDGKRVELRFGARGERPYGTRGIPDLSPRG